MVKNINIRIDQMLSLNPNYIFNKGISLLKNSFDRKSHMNNIIVKLLDYAII